MKHINQLLRLQHNVKKDGKCYLFKLTVSLSSGSLQLIMEAEAQAESIRVSPLYYTLSSSPASSPSSSLQLNEIWNLVPSHFKIWACVLDEG